MTTCPYCGREWELDVLEVWPEERTFQLVACCEEAEEEARADLADGEVPRQDFVAFFRDRTGLDVRQLVRGGLEAGLAYGNGGLTLDWGLELGPIDWATARAFIAEHHRHHGAPRGWRWGHAMRNGPELVAVATVGRPVARAYDPAEVVEVNRLAVNPTLPPGLAWNACSQLYGAAAREARRRGYRRIITYTLASEPATTLKAAGWQLEAELPARRRGWRGGQPIAAKRRWGRAL